MCTLPYTPPCLQSTLTLLKHASFATLAQAALLALAAHVHVHFAAVAVLAGVLRAFDHAAAEEALAALAAQHVVVEPGGLVAAHAAHFVPQHLWRRALLPLRRGPLWRQTVFKKGKSCHFAVFR